MGILIFRNTLSGQQLAFNNIFSIGNAALFNGEALCHANWLSAQSACNVELVVAQRRGGRLKAGCQFNGRIYADTDRNWKRLAQRFSLFVERADMASTRNHIDGNLIGTLQAQAMNGDVRDVRFGVGCVAHTQSDIRTRIFRRIGRCRNKLAYIEAFFSGKVHHFSAYCLFFRHINGRHRVQYCLVEHEAQALRISIKQLRYPIATCEQANSNTCIGMALDVIEHHGGAFLCGTGHRTACADVAIHAAQLRLGVYLDVSFHQLTRDPMQKLKRAAKIVNVITHKFSLLQNMFTIIGE